MASITELEKNIVKFADELKKDGFTADYRCFRTRKKSKTDVGVSRCVITVKNESIDETITFLANGFIIDEPNAFGGTMTWKEMRTAARKRLTEKILTSEK